MALRNCSMPSTLNGLPHFFFAMDTTDVQEQPGGMYAQRFHDDNTFKL